MLTWHNLVCEDPRVARPNIAPHSEDVRHPTRIEGGAVEGAPKAADKQVRDVPHRCRLPQSTHTASAEASLEFECRSICIGTHLGVALDEPHHDDALENLERLGRI